MDTAPTKVAKGLTPQACAHLVQVLVLPRQTLHAPLGGRHYQVHGTFVRSNRGGFTDPARNFERWRAALCTGSLQRRRRAALHRLAKASSSYDWPFLASVQICRMEGIIDLPVLEWSTMTAAAAKPAREGEHKRLDEVRCIIRRQEEQIESLRCENERLKDDTGSEAKVSP